MTSLTALQWLHQGWSRSCCHQVHLWRRIWVYISMISWDGGFLSWADQCGTAWTMLVQLRETPVDCVCMYCVKHASGSGFHRVHDVAPGVIGASVVCDRWCGPHCTGGRQGCGCSGSFIIGDRCARSDDIWVMFMKGVEDPLVVSYTDKLY